MNLPGKKVRRAVYVCLLKPFALFLFFLFLSAAKPTGHRATVRVVVVVVVVRGLL